MQESTRPDGRENIPRSSTIYDLKKKLKRAGGEVERVVMLFMTILDRRESSKLPCSITYWRWGRCPYVKIAR